MLGLVLVRGLDEDSQIIVWVRAVATAMLAGVMAQLDHRPPAARWPRSRCPCGLAPQRSALSLSWSARRSVFVGVLVGEVLFLAGAWWFGP